MSDITMTVPGWLAMYFFVCLGLLILLDGIRALLWIYDWRLRRRTEKGGER